MSRYSAEVLWERQGGDFLGKRYSPAASGVMDKNADGKMAMTLVTLRPEVTFSGKRLAHTRRTGQAAARGA